MKARNTKTGKEITILGISTEWGTATYIEDGILHQENLSGEWEIIDESAPVDWSSFRREAAKDILVAAIKANDEREVIFEDKNFPCYVRQSIKLADELIAKLKEK